MTTVFNQLVEKSLISLTESEERKEWIKTHDSSYPIGLCRKCGEELFLGERPIVRMSWMKFVHEDCWKEGKKR
jgi:hypothetical protein